MQIKKLNEEIEQLLEEYHVYNPEDNEGIQVDSKGLRNIMMYYFLSDNIQGVYDRIRQQIDKMPDEWVIQFLNNQQDTKVRSVYEH